MNLKNDLLEDGQVVVYDPKQELSRFYVGRSVVYGLTVYDRMTQTPAFTFGAECSMKDEAANYLSIMLTHHDRNGTLQAYIERRSTREA